MQGVWADIDTAQIERVFENLFVNAIRHTPDNTSVYAEATRHDDGVLITVEDDGPGVAIDDRSRIFMPFAQGHESGRGTNIGLALVAKFAELHGGRAWVEESALGGAKFCVLLNEGSSTDRAGSQSDQQSRRVLELVRGESDARTSTAS